ncbi:MAG: S-methyl-5-thioribose-1-phosphate isomerase [Chloroflexi bacterium]|nr:S-methyl-5-thioribose-1-phosphate isomerase [Chloroflexota bacterium]
MVPLEWTGDSLRILDQTKLPQEQAVIVARSPNQVVEAIKGMQVRGAPALGVAGAYAMALAVKAVDTLDVPKMQSYLKEMAKQVAEARPTAVNLRWAVERVLRSAMGAHSMADLRTRVDTEAITIHREDVAANRRMGALGAELLPAEGTVMTHCNAGALATAGYGTALGVIRAAWEKSRKLKVIANETRPLLQGARLTAWELVQMGIPTTLVVDSAAGSLIARGEVDCVIVGADRVAANGDTANKIGTYTLAVVAHEKGVPFYVAAPTSTVDMSITTGAGIPIEERPPEEVTEWGGRRIAPKGVGVRNPAFDVTPARYITAIITEKGIVRPPYEEGLRQVMEGGGA